MNREAVSARLREHHTTLEKLDVKSLASFGSLARGEVGPESVDSRPIEVHNVTIKIAFTKQCGPCIM